jgi:DUF1680 family protein
MEADPRIDAVRGCVALERGPLVYAVEQVDQSEGVTVDDLHLVVGEPPQASYEEGLLGGVTVLRAKGRVGTGHRGGGWPYAEAGDGGVSVGEEVEVVAIPYYAWANREIGAMRVWLPRA